jgi:hypothetical protein
MKLLMIALAVSLLAGCAIVPLEPYYHHGYYRDRGDYGGHGYYGRRYDGPYNRGYGYGYGRGY